MTVACTAEGFSRVNRFPASPSLTRARARYTAHLHMLHQCPETDHRRRASRYLRHPRRRRCFIIITIIAIIIIIIIKIYRYRCDGIAVQSRGVYRWSRGSVTHMNERENDRRPVGNSYSYSLRWYHGLLKIAFRIRVVQRSRSLEW